MGKSTISMAIVNSYATNYQRVAFDSSHFCCFQPVTVTSTASEAPSSSKRRRASSSCAAAQAAWKWHEQCRARREMESSPGKMVIYPSKIEVV